MVTRKYVRDYKFSETLTDKGRLKTEAVYVGAYYRLAEPAAAKKAARSLLVLLGLAWCIFVGTMIPKTGAMRLTYVILPHAFLALPLGYLFGTAYRTRRAKERFVRSEADKLSGRIAPAAVSGMALSGIALFGEIVSAIVLPERMMGSDLLFGAGDAALLAIMAYAFRNRSRFRTVREEDPPERADQP